MIAAALLLAAAAAAAPPGLTLESVLALRSVGEAWISPDGASIAYTVAVPRDPFAEDDGEPRNQLWVAGPGDRALRAFVSDERGVSHPRFLPDGRAVAFLAKRGDEKAKKGIWVIPIDGGDARHAVAHGEDVTAFAFSPDGRRVAFLAPEPEADRVEKLAKKGFKAKVVEERPRFTRAYVATLGSDGPAKDARMLPLEGSASELSWGPRGDAVALALAPTPFVDDEYMNRIVHVVDPETGAVKAKVGTTGKLAAVRWAPDGRHLAVLAGEDRHDPNAGRLLVADVATGASRDLLPGWEGDVEDAAFSDADTVIFVGHQGVETTLEEIDLDSGSARKVLVRPGGPALYALSVSAGGNAAALLADSPSHPREAFRWSRGVEGIIRLSTSNPSLAGVRLAPQEIWRFVARDGMNLEGLLIRPLDVATGTRVPLILVVHGGPEAHYSNGWLTRYGGPGQFAAARGYAVFYPNYRGSTGRGVAFSKLGQADYAGKEFDDLVDGVKSLIDAGIVDAKRVGVTGGSYGGYASAWLATRHTEHFAASVMFVGLSDKVAAFGTTDIPNEMNLVHARKWPWEDWAFYEERSPIRWVEQARTPILILHGEEDTRVHPTQSLSLFRFLKTYGKVPVRLVLYPGEGHGNRKAAAQMDYALRMMEWFDHYLKGPGGAMPAPEAALKPVIERLEPPASKTP